MKNSLYRLIFSKFKLSLENRDFYLFLLPRNILFYTLVLLMNLPISPLLSQTPTIEESTVGTLQDNRLNYLGVGGAIGLRDEGETALGEGGFTILGRFSFTNNISIHSSAIFNDNDLLSAAVTYGTPIKIFFPFVGAGISADTDNFNVNPEITSGVDLPINSLLTGTARVNANFDDETDIGLIFGVGVNF